MKRDCRTNINKRIMLSMVLIVSFVLLILICTIGCSNNDSESGTSQEFTGTIDEDGGNFEMGQVNMEFPANSVGSEVSITGEPVFIDNLPEDLIPLSSVYEISLSDLDEYISHSATLSFNLRESAEGKGVSIYHSSDGVTWDKLESTVEGNTISASVPGFSYFVAARGRIYSLRVINKSRNSWEACLFQYDSQWRNSGVMPVSWYSKYLHNSTSFTFQWVKDYSFCWAETGLLRPGVIFMSSQTINGDLSSNNKITLTNQQGAGQFINLCSGDPQGSMTIVQDSTILMQRFAIGLAMSGSPFCAAQAAPNMVTSFVPTNTKYYITMGNYRMGEVLDIYYISNKAEIVFPPGVYSMTATYNANGTWKVTSGDRSFSP
ncbi:MAG: hypothetical protein K8T10_13975 [Candidatus Eremiobacteraeota bacterium]|nr:hypothetical protein [Candidatus Eremiobacteraeota bacterium]